jgi:hypothetical protein
MVISPILVHLDDNRIAFPELQPAWDLNCGQVGGGFSTHSGGDIRWVFFCAETGLVSGMPGTPA